MFVTTLKKLRVRAFKSVPSNAYKGQMEKMSEFRYSVCYGRRKLHQSVPNSCSGRNQASSAVCEPSTTQTPPTAV